MKLYTIDSYITHPNKYAFMTFFCFEDYAVPLGKTDRKLCMY